MYSKIKNNLSGDLLIINNVSTAIALDVGLKMLGHGSFEQIVESTKRLIALMFSSLKDYLRIRIFLFHVCPV